MSIDVTGFSVFQDGTYPFSRSFVATPHKEIVTEFETYEKIRGRMSLSTYPANVFSIRVSFQWDDEKKYWWGQALEHIEVLNYRTGEPYRSGWRSETVRKSYGPKEKMPDYIRLLIDSLNPRTTITVTETPND